MRMMQLSAWKRPLGWPLRVALHLLLGASVLAAAQARAQADIEPRYPDRWPVVSSTPTKTLLVTDSVRRFGQTLHFATAASGFAGLGQLLIAGAERRLPVSFKWYWMKCANEWIAEVSSAPGGLMTEASPEHQFAEAATHAAKPRPWPIEFWHLTDPRGPGASAEFRRITMALCQTAPPSSADIEVPVAEGKRSTTSDIGFIDLLMLRTLKQRGDQVEGWVRRLQTEPETLKDGDGKDAVGRDGKPLTLPRYSSRSALVTYKAHARCASRTVAATRRTEYAPEGLVQPSATKSDSTKWEEPVPGSVGERFLDALCNAVATPAEPRPPRKGSRIVSRLDLDTEEAGS